MVAYLHGRHDYSTRPVGLTSSSQLHGLAEQRSYIHPCEDLEPRGSLTLGHYCSEDYSSDQELALGSPHVDPCPPKSP